jgi:flagellar basal-body rod protein FlgC
MNFFPELTVSASGLSAERARLEVIARNIANVNTNQTAAGGVFRRQLVELMSAPADPEAGDPGGVQVAGVREDQSPLRMVYDPSSPDANDDGYVAKPNVDLMLEMVDMLGATRAYEANVSAIQSAKDMVRKALEL